MTQDGYLLSSHDLPIGVHDAGMDKLGHQICLQWKEMNQSMCNTCEQSGCTSLRQHKSELQPELMLHG